MLQLISRFITISTIIAAFLTPPTANAQTDTTLVVSEEIITDFRTVVARLESSDTLTARSRLPGVITRLNIDEGSVVKKGQVLATVLDESLNPQIAALDANIAGIEGQLTQLRQDFKRAQKLQKKGFYSTAKLDAARTAVTVTEKQLASVKAQRATLTSRRSKGKILAPTNARVTKVSVVKGSIVLPGEIIAHLATLEGVVRLSLPERHASQIKQGESLQLLQPSRGNDIKYATISKIYPELSQGSVIADAIVQGGLEALVGERIDVLVPVGQRRALRIPKVYITTRYGIDFIRVHVGERRIDAPVTLANPKADSEGFVEVLAGLHSGDVIELPEG
ncbi:MAG: efflux RND transporter periplasmic adaptor subunit [Robiginitomaculum sp.]